jgi:hypothetical protein
MQCDEKARFIDLYKGATAAFARAFDEQYAHSGTSSKVEYEELRQRADQARREADQARLNLDRHISQHGC